MVSSTPNDYPLVEETVMKLFSVGECLSCVNAVSGTGRVINETPKILANDGMGLTRFAVNDAQLLVEIPEKWKAEEFVDFDTDYKAKALAIKWCSSDYSFLQDQ